GGLAGKHDNVRTFWEDRVRTQRLRPYLKDLVANARKSGRKLRITDLGAGSGEGLRILLDCDEHEADISLHHAKVLDLDMLETYIGTDLCEAMVAQGNVNFADEKNVTFQVGDFSKGFP